MTVLQVCEFIKGRHVQSEVECEHTVNILSNRTGHDLSTSRCSKRFCKFSTDTQMPYTLKIRDLFNNQINAQFLYSITICILHYNPRHISSIEIPIFRRTNCIITASGIVTLCKRLYSMPDEIRLCIFCYTRWMRYSYCALNWLLK